MVYKAHILLPNYVSFIIIIPFESNVPYVDKMHKTLYKKKAYQLVSLCLILVYTKFKIRAIAPIWILFVDN
ncbi:hypothetical protein GCM10009128_23100 [Psychrosphaera haliotis]